MESWPPTTEELLQLPVDELAIRMLRKIAETSPRSLHRGNLADYRSPVVQGVDNDSLPINRAIAEAYDWLLFNGLVANNPGHHNAEFAYVTERGRKLLDNPHPLRTLKATKRLDMELHSRIASRVRSQFILGEYESAVFLAFREVEIRVRVLGEFDASEVGVPLMRKAFNPNENKRGPLVDTSLDPGEQESMMYLFAGAIGAFKNPSSHRQVDYGDATVAAEAVLLADLLLRILDRY